jgi:hypothetical protein
MAGLRHKSQQTFTLRRSLPAVSRRSFRWAVPHVNTCALRKPPPEPQPEGDGVLASASLETLRFASPTPSASSVLPQD